MKPLLLTIGNIYLDHNIFGIIGPKDKFKLEEGKDYFGTSAERVLGGSAVNTALQASKLGIDVGFVGKIGHDQEGQKVKSLLSQCGIINELLSEDSEASTSMAVNLVSKNGGFVGVHYGDSSKNLSDDDIDLNHHLFKRCQAVYFGGTMKQPKLLGAGEKLFQELSGRGIKIFYDPNRFPAHKDELDHELVIKQLQHVEGYFPNEEEILELTNKSSIDEALDTIITTGVRYIVVKSGSKGCRVRTQNEDFTIDAHEISPVSTVGAGDCFNAAFIVFYLKGMSLKECAKYANAAASIKVSQNIWPSEDQIFKMLGGSL